MACQTMPQEFSAMPLAAPCPPRIGHSRRFANQVIGRTVMPNRNGNSDRRPGVSRRTFLADTGMGFTGLALSAMLWQDGVARGQEHALPDGRPHFRPKAKSVIWLFMCGGVSHVESFDVKPELNRY